MSDETNTAEQGVGELPAGWNMTEKRKNLLLLGIVVVLMLFVAWVEDPRDYWLHRDSCDCQACYEKAMDERAAELDAEYEAETRNAEPVEQFKIKTVPNPFEVGAR